MIFTVNSMPLKQSSPGVLIPRLREACELVYTRVSKLLATGRSLEPMGIGASGDESLRIDVEAESAVIDYCRQLPISSTLVSEEIGELEIKPNTSRSTDLGYDHLWVVLDPIDGSRNVLRGIPFFNTSIALANGPSLNDLVAGVIYNLVSKNEYITEKGVGAFYNGVQAHPSSRTEIRGALIGVNIVADSLKEDPLIIKACSNAKTIRQMGANAEEIAFVGTGALDAFVNTCGRLRITDMAAAKLFVQQAGAIITDEGGHPHDYTLAFDRRLKIVASGNPSFHKTLLTI